MYDKIHYKLKKKKKKKTQVKKKKKIGKKKKRYNTEPLRWDESIFSFKVLNKPEPYL